MKLSKLIDYLALASGSILGQALTILFAPILSRIYTAEEMGFYTLVLTATGMFESAVCLRYDLIIVSEKDEKKIIPLIRLCTQIALITSIIVTIIYSAYIAISHQCERNQMWLFLLNFPIMFCYALSLIANARNNRRQEYKLLSVASVVQGGVHNGLSAVLGLCGFGAVGLIIGRTFGYFANYLVSVKLKIISIFGGKADKYSKDQYISILEDNKKQVFYSTPAVILSCVAYSIINIFISRLYGDAVLGLYSYSYRLLGIPLAVISTNISRMFFKDAAIEYNRCGSMRRSFYKLLFPIIGVSVVMFLGFRFLAPDAFAIFLGEKWREAGVYVQILAPMFSIRLVSNCFTNVTIVTGKQLIAFIIQITYLIATIGLYVYARITDIDIYSFLNIMNVLFCVIYSLYFFVLAQMCTKRMENKYEIFK